MIRHYNVISLGESTIDAFMTLAHGNNAMYADEKKGGVCFRHGEKIDVQQYDFCIGGNATNVAVGLTRLGLKTTLCSETGDDEFSIKIRNCLASERIERLFVTQTPGASSFSVVINYNGDRTIFVQDVTREHNFTLEDVTTDLVYLTSLGREWKRPYKMVLEFVKKHPGTKLAFNPGSIQLHEGKDVIMQVIKQTDILFVNKEEAEIILFDKQTAQNEKDYIVTLMEKLQKIGPKVVVITNGASGSHAIDETGKAFWQGISDGILIERTGAGDAYTTGFLGASLYGLSLPVAMKWGMINATSVVGSVGAQKGLLRRHEIEEKVALL